MPTVFLKDYQPSAHTISHTELLFELNEENTRVTSTLSIHKQDVSTTTPLRLNGGDFELESVALNGIALGIKDYSVENNELTLHALLDDEFKLTVVTKINPKNNTALEGLYKAGDLLTTQCESEGFRNITFYLDRPDVLATFTTEIRADKIKYPVLLSNGNLIHSGDHETDKTKHMAIYHDPVPKPCYLFALVAGQLALQEDFFITRSKNRVALKIYAPADDLHKTCYAMQALKDAMRFDEEHYDREYDLEAYNIVGVPQFNMGAMENKGLNIFNVSSLLVDPATSKDDDFENVALTVGHEYFHNWRGNRVTVKNWFQLSLKEGFATITEQEFLQSLSKSMVSRIDDIKILQSRQFPQDDGPLAHAVMPEQYETTENLYTTTTYFKGAELLNMLKSLLGKETFKTGCSLYFTKHDGKSANIEDFLSAMQEASSKDLSQFLLWYQQIGRPTLEFESRYEESTETYRLTVKQSFKAASHQTENKPHLIPIAIGLLDKHGNDMPLQLEGEKPHVGTTLTLLLTEEEQTFTFINIKEEPVPSLLRNFSAPVSVGQSPLSTENHIFLLKHDRDPINRWIAAQTLAKQTILKAIHELQAVETPVIDPSIIDAFRSILLDPSIEPRLTTELLTFPPINTFYDSVKPVDPDLIFQARELFINQFIRACSIELKTAYITLAKISATAAYSPESAGIRSLKNLCLSYLMKTNNPEITKFCVHQIHTATNMTDTLGALTPLAAYHNVDRADVRQEQLDIFSQKWQHDDLTIQHLLRLYAISEAPDALDQVIKMTQNPLFKRDNPNHLRALVSCFCTSNPNQFHDPSGRAYQFITDFLLIIDKTNPSSAASLVPAFSQWKLFEPVRQEKMLEQLYRLHATPNLSETVKELVDKSLQEAIIAKKPDATGRPFALFSRPATPPAMLESQTEPNIVATTWV